MLSNFYNQRRLVVPCDLGRIFPIAPHLEKNHLVIGCVPQLKGLNFVIFQQHGQHFTASNRFTLGIVKALATLSYVIFLAYAADYVTFKRRVSSIVMLV